MARPRWIQAWRSLGLEFWLVLPLLGLGLWLSSGILTDHMLTRFDKTSIYLEGDRQPPQQPPKLKAITVVIHLHHQTSTVTVETANSALTQLVYQFPTTDPTQIEVAISQSLGLPRDRIRDLVRYQPVPAK